jgi:HPt (histidine-containing phosphotransfer) domain-containing protein
MPRGTQFQQQLDAGARARLRQKPIDMAHLASQTLGDKNLELEVLRLFDDTVRIYYGRLELSTTVEELMIHLHTLKGAAAGVGARQIAALAATAESELRAGEPVNPERIDDIGMAVEEVRTFISAILEQAAE